MRAGAVARRRLDLDHLGAEAGEQEARVLGLLVCDLDDAHPREHRVRSLRRFAHLRPVNRSSPQSVAFTAGDQRLRSSG